MAKWSQRAQQKQNMPVQIPASTSGRREREGRATTKLSRANTQQLMHSATANKPSYVPSTHYDNLCEPYSITGLEAGTGEGRGKYYTSIKQTMLQNC